MSGRVRAVLVAGPTASGKSALAVGLAARLGGWVVNADSQQAYGDWRVLTARPSAEEEARAPHRLYGHLALHEGYSVGRWLRDLAPVLDAAAAAGAVPVIVGGTGLYFRALTEGLAEVPEVPAPIRAELEARAAAEGAAALAAALAKRDPETAAGLDLANPARIVRALGVLEATGRGLAAWQAETPPPLLPAGACLRLAVDTDRAWLNARIDRRFVAMVKDGALAEAEAVRAQRPSPSAPGLRAIGARALIAHLDGRMSLAEAVATGQQTTRQYAKRQATWIRNQMADWQRIAPGDLDACLALWRAAGGRIVE